MLCSMALPSKLCAALANLVLFQCVIASHAEVLDLSVWVQILSGVDSDHGTGPRRNGSFNKVNIMSNRKKVMLTKNTPLSSHLADYVL